MPSNTSRREIICPECPNVYSESEIFRHRNDEAKPLIQILGSSEQNDSKAATETKAAGRMLRRLFGKDQTSHSESNNDLTLNSQKRKLANIDRLKDWQFRCPEGHTVDGNRGLQLPIAVVGPSGASKSHFLPALIWETSLQRSLGPLGISLRAGQFTSSGLDFAMTQVYQHRQILQATPPNEVTGPFGYRLSVQRNGEEMRYSLLLFDVGGEALSTIVKISEQAAFVLLCQAIVVLIDPQELLPTEFDTSEHSYNDRERVIAAARIRDGITRIADTLEELWDCSMRDIPVPMCFVVAKADSIDWVFEWDRETALVIESTKTGTDLHDALVESSHRVQTQFGQLGGQLIVDEIAERFDLDRVRFCAASATSEMPVFPTPGEESVAGSWQDPIPQGTSLTLLHALDLLGKIGSPHVADDELRAE